MVSCRTEQFVETDKVIKEKPCAYDVSRSFYALLYRRLLRWGNLTNSTIIC